MPDRDHKKAYIPWHERVDEFLIRELTAQFVQTIYKHGIRLTEVNVKWKGSTGEFEVDTIGERLPRTKPAPGEATH